MAFCDPLRGRLAVPRSALVGCAARLAVCALAPWWLVYGPAVTSAATLQVGPGRTYPVPSAAAAVASDGDVVEIDAGEYVGDVAFWTANALTIRGVGGMAHLRAAGNSAGGKAIWVIQGNNTTVEYIEFSEATVPDKNGAGIRQEGPGLTVRHCSFHDNENGILTGADGASDILIEHSEFARNGYGDGYSHNLYIGHVNSLTFRYNYSHHAIVGHAVKSRAFTNYILYNRIMDEADGASSRLIDLPNGGTAVIIGNLLHQGTSTNNSNMFCFACEGATNPNQALSVVNNTFVNDRWTGTFVDNRAAVTALVANNLFVGNGTTVTGPATEQTNLAISTDPGFVSISTYNYRLTEGATGALDHGSDPGSAGGFDLTPVAHYVHPLASEIRPAVGALDIGAYEFGREWIFTDDFETGDHGAWSRASP
jgi:hypothetical protein